MITVDGGVRTAAFPIVVSTWVSDNDTFDAWPGAPSNHPVPKTDGDPPTLMNGGVQTGGLGFTPRFNPFGGGLPGATPSNPTP